MKESKVDITTMFNHGLLKYFIITRDLCRKAEKHISIYF